VLLAVDPTLTHAEVQELLEQGAEDGVGPPLTDPPGRDDQFGHGRANLFRSLCALDGGGPTIVTPELIGVESSGPDGLAGDDPAVRAALASIGAVDDLDPVPLVRWADPPHLPLGVKVALEVTALDACGHETRRTLALVAEDRRAPRLALTLARAQLDPAGGALELVGLRAKAEDACDPRPVLEERVYTDEPPRRDAPDAARDARGGLLLRAERDALGDGRVYLVLVRARDAAGNLSWDAASVVVPLDSGSAALADVLAQAAHARATVLATGAPPAGFFELPAASAGVRAR
jgi:hypothetical protein